MALIRANNSVTSLRQQYVLGYGFNAHKFKTVYRRELSRGMHQKVEFARHAS